MMLLSEAIELLAPFHNAQLVCVIRNSDNTVSAQLSTGCAELPFIAVNHSQVMLEDVLEVIEALAGNVPASINLFQDYAATNDLNIWAA